MFMHSGCGSVRHSPPSAGGPVSIISRDRASVRRYRPAPVNNLNFSEYINDFFNNILKIIAGTIDGPVGILFVQGNPLVIHVGKTLARN